MGVTVFRGGEVGFGGGMRRRLWSLVGGGFHERREMDLWWEAGGGLWKREAAKMVAAGKIGGFQRRGEVGLWRQVGFG